MTHKEKYRLAKIGALKLPPVVAVLQGKDYRGRQYWWLQPEGTDVTKNSGVISGVQWIAQRASRRYLQDALRIYERKVYRL